MWNLRNYLISCVGLLNGSRKVVKEKGHVGAMLSYKGSKQQRGRRVENSWLHLIYHIICIKISNISWFKIQFFFIWLWFWMNYYTGILGKWRHFLTVIAIFGCQIINRIWTFQLLMSLFFFLGKVKSRKTLEILSSGLISSREGVRHPQWL